MRVGGHTMEVKGEGDQESGACTQKIDILLHKYLIIFTLYDYIFIDIYIYMYLNHLSIYLQNMC